MEISDIFSTNQGEGPRTGVNSVFLRLRRCNLACTWCDTPYSVFRDHPGWLEYTDQTPQEAADEVFGMLQRKGSENLVITGGEPLIWKEQIKELLDLLPYPPDTVEVETNGTVPPLPVEYDRAYGITYNVSPKLAHSGNAENARLAEDVLEEFAKRSSVFKFVVRGLEDTAEMEAWQALLHKYRVTDDRILLMPLGTTSEDLDSRLIEVTNMAYRMKVSVTDRMHIRWYGDVRGT